MLFKLFKILLTRFIIPLYIKIILIIYRLHILLIPPLTVALTVHPIFSVLSLPLSLLSFCLIGKELIFPPFIFYYLPYLLIGMLAVISHLLIFFLGVPLLAFAVIITIF